MNNRTLYKSHLNSIINNKNNKISARECLLKQICFKSLLEAVYKGYISNKKGGNLGEAILKRSTLSLIINLHVGMLRSPGGGGGATLDFKWRGRSNGGKNQNPKISVSLQTKPKKIPAPKINSKKIPCRISEHEKFSESIKWYNTKFKNIRNQVFVFVYSSCHLKLLWLFILFWMSPKNPYLNQATQKDTCKIFPPKKILWSSPSLEIWSTPPFPLGKKCTIILSQELSALADNTLLDLHISSGHSQPYPIIANFWPSLRLTRLIIGPVLFFAVPMLRSI